MSDGKNMKTTACSRSRFTADRASRVRVVLYHHIVESPCVFTDRLGVTTPPGLFESHLEYYEKHYDVISLDDLMRGELPKRPLLITFDDAYRSIVDTAAPMLRSRGMSAVFFVATHPITTGQLMLDNLLCFLVNEVGMDALKDTLHARTRSIESLGQLIASYVSELRYEKRSALSARLADRFGIDQKQLASESGLYLDREDLAAFPENGLEPGNHTASHVHCRALAPDDIKAEIVGPKTQLEQWTGREVRVFSYPYGNNKDATPLVRRAVQDSGHSSSFLVHGRTNQFREDGTIWYRVSLATQQPGDIWKELEMLPRLRTIRDVVSRHSR